MSELAFCHVLCAPRMGTGFTPRAVWVAYARYAARLGLAFPSRNCRPFSQSATGAEFLAEAFARWPKRSCAVWSKPFKNFEGYGGNFVRF